MRAFSIPSKKAVPRRVRSQRRLVAAIGWTATGFCFLLLSFLVIWILSVVFIRGWGAMSPKLFTTVTQGRAGGLLNAIEGTVLISTGALLLSVPLGIGSGIFLSEYRSSSWANVVRFLSDVLVGVPSIVLGYFGYVSMVEGLGWHFSLAAASIILAMLCLPYICRTTEFALRQVPNELREASYALGATEARVILGVCLPAARSGVMTGVLLALAISVGETAPLIYTAGWSSYLWDGRLTHSPVGYLTYVIWTFINEPFASANALAYAAAFLVTSFVLVVNILSRVLLNRSPY